MTVKSPQNDSILDPLLPLCLLITTLFVCLQFGIPISLVQYQNHLAITSRSWAREVG